MSGHVWVLRRGDDVCGTSVAVERMPWSGPNNAIQNARHVGTITQLEFQDLEQSIIDADVDKYGDPLVSMDVSALFTLTLQSLALPRGEDGKECVWTLDGGDGAYRTGCGKYWQFTEGNATDNGMKFCYNCGRKADIDESRECEGCSENTDRVDSYGDPLCEACEQKALAERDADIADETRAAAAMTASATEGRGQ